MTTKEALRRLSRLELERIKREHAAFERVVLEAIAEAAPETRERILVALIRHGEAAGWQRQEGRDVQG